MKKILIVHTGGGLGDVLLSTPVIEALAAVYPQAQIDFLARKSTSAAIRNHPKLHKIMTIDAPEPGWAKLFSWAGRLRAERYEAALVLWSKTQLAFMLYLAGIPIRVGQDSRFSYSWTYTHKVSVRSEHGDTTSHWSQILLDFVRILNPAIPETAPSFVIPETAQEKAKQLLQDLPDLPGPIIGFHPCKDIKNPLKRWPIEVFAQWVKMLAEQRQARIVITGGPAEITLAEKLIELSQVPCLNIAGKTDIDTLAAVTTQCRVFICPDSGPMHLASVCHTPVVGIYALKEDFPKRWAPSDPHHVSIILSPNPCPRRCIKAHCPDFQCYSHIEGQQILEAVDQLLETSSA